MTRPFDHRTREEDLESKGAAMYAVFVVSEIDPKRLDEADAMLRETLVPKIKAAPGFVSGTWARGAGGEARSIALFETEEAAKATFQAVAAGMPADGPVTIKTSSILEVALQV
ncbi:MAG TPA: hypothetical protein VGB52_04030 [Actinomycetota bacterium]|jgi:hypothetical protein